MTPLYRIMVKPKGKPWRYVTADILRKVIDVPEQKDGKPVGDSTPFIFKDLPTAERVARALTDFPEYERVVLRSEKDGLDLKGGGAS